MESLNLTISNNKYRVWWHVIFWTTILVYYTFFFGHQGGYYLHTLKFMAILLPVAISTSYLFNYYLIPKFLLKRKIKTFILLSFYALIVSFYLISLIIFPFLIINTSEVNFATLDKTLLDIYFLVVGIYAAIIMAILIKLIKLSNHRQHQHLQLLKEKTAAELEALRSQINPHFLFNTLNSIYTLSLKKSDKTPEVVLKLSDMLDYLLYKCNADKVELSLEVRLIENYLFLQQVRFEKRVKIDFEIEGKMDNHMISPMLFLPFIENCFKHGAGKTRNESLIKIKLISKANYIEFQVNNGKPEIGRNMHMANSGGIGLENVRKRLELIYKDAHDLIISDNLKDFSVLLKIETS